MAEFRVMWHASKSTGLLHAVGIDRQCLFACSKSVGMFLSLHELGMVGVRNWICKRCLNLVQRAECEWEWEMAPPEVLAPPSLSQWQRRGNWQCLCGDEDNSERRCVTYGWRTSQVNLWGAYCSECWPKAIRKARRLAKRLEEIHELRKHIQAQQREIKWLLKQREASVLS